MSGHIELEIELEIEEKKPMSSIDTNQEFYSDLDDWWAQLWAMQIGAPLPSERTKLKFFSFVKSSCQEAGDWRIKDNDMSILFSDFITSECD